MHPNLTEVKRVFTPSSNFEQNIEQHKFDNAVNVPKCDNLSPSAGVCLIPPVPSQGTPADMVNKCLPSPGPGPAFAETPQLQLSWGLGMAPVSNSGYKDRGQVTWGRTAKPPSVLGRRVVEPVHVVGVPGVPGGMGRMPSAKVWEDPQAGVMHLGLISPERIPSDSPSAKVPHYVVDVGTPRALVVLDGDLWHDLSYFDFAPSVAPTDAQLYS